MLDGLEYITSIDNPYSNLYSFQRFSMVQIHWILIF